MSDGTPREVFRQAVKDVLTGMTGVRRWGTTTGQYPNAPRVADDVAAFFQQNYYPALAVVRMPGSQITTGNRDGSERDLFRFDICGRMNKPAADQSPRLWADRLHYDCARTLREAQFTGLFAMLPGGVACHWIDFGEEDQGGEDTYEDFVLPCTATLTYTLAER